MSGNDRQGNVELTISAAEVAQPPRYLRESKKLIRDKETEIKEIARIAARRILGE